MKIFTSTETLVPFPGFPLPFSTFSHAVTLDFNALYSTPNHQPNLILFNKRYFK